MADVALDVSTAGTSASHLVAPVFLDEWRPAYHCELASRSRFRGSEDSYICCNSEPEQQSWPPRWCALRIHHPLCPVPSQRTSSVCASPSGRADSSRFRNLPCHNGTPYLLRPTDTLRHMDRMGKSPGSRYPPFVAELPARFAPVQFACPYRGRALAERARIRPGTRPSRDKRDGIWRARSPSRRLVGHSPGRTTTDASVIYPPQALCVGLTWRSPPE